MATVDSTRGPAPKLQSVLLVDDDQADIRLIAEAFLEFPDIRLHVVTEVAQAIGFLTKRDEFAQSPTPSLVLLDLRMPLYSGMILLEERRRRGFCAMVPIIVLTTLLHERENCRALGAAAYHLKPTRWTGWQVLIRELTHGYLTADRQSSDALVVFSTVTDVSRQALKPSAGQAGYAG